MEEKNAYIEREQDKILQAWSSRCSLLGAVVFMALWALDVYAAPELAPRFLAYRSLIAGYLLAAAVLLRRARGRGAIRLLVFLGVLLSASVIELMILDFGGDGSPYLMGQVLLAVMVAGLIPASAPFAGVLAGTIFAVYLVPIMVWDTVAERVSFTIHTVLMVCILTATVLVRWFHTRHLVGEISLRYDLTRSGESLEQEVARGARITAELSESREFLSSITTAAMDAIVMIDPGGTIRYWNPAAAEIFGYQECEILGRGPFTLLAAPEVADALLADFRRWQAGGESAFVGHRSVSRGRRKSGECFPMELAMAAVERGGALWACALLTDVTVRTSNEDRLSLFAAAVEDAAEGIFIVDLDGKIVYCNAPAAEQSGRTRSEVVGRNIRQLNRDPAMIEARIMPTLLNIGRWAGEVAGTHRDGRLVRFWLTASLVRNGAGRPIAMIGLTRDVEQQRKLEAERVRAQKIESIGVLAGGLAHDFNNLLTIILGNLDLARLLGGPDPELNEALDHAGEAAQRAGDLTRQLITFSKGGKPVKRVGPVQPLLRETVLFASSGSNLVCEFDLPESVPLVNFDEGQMRQVIHNLVRNAREAMPEGGTLRVGGSAVALVDGEVPALPAGSYVRLEFADQGTGIAQENLSRIFEPYFSTKEMDTAKGRGLGLAVSYSIVHNHGGAITAESALGQGTRVAVYLPVAAAAEESPLPAGSACAAVGGEESGEPALAERVPDGAVRGRVLVMDDEPLVLEMAGSVLQRLGYAATLCRSGAETIVRYQIALDTGKRYDAVILDLTVPGEGGGAETLTRLREIDPGVRAALSSGYADHPAVADWATWGFAAFIAKPYSIKAFEDLLSSLA